MLSVQISCDLFKKEKEKEKEEEKDDTIDLLHDTLILDTDYWYGSKSSIENINKQNLTKYHKYMRNKLIADQMQRLETDQIIEYILFICGRSFFDIKNKTNISYWVGSKSFLVSYTV